MRNKGFAKSHQMYKEACRYLAGGVSSHFRAAGRPHPLFFSHGQGSRVFDVDGNEYIDFTLAQGPLILGHSHPDLLRRVSKELSRGQLFAAQFPLELELAKRLSEILPCAERMRFCNTGSEAVHAALRLARGVTGKTKILKFEGHYHGWFDNVLVSIHPSPEAAGPENHPSAVLLSGGQPSSVTQEVVVRSWNDLEAVESCLEQDPDIAAVITEPVMCNTGCILPKPGFLEGLRRACDRHQIPLIFDEIITGFRLALGGAQEHFGVVPDLAVYGKAIAGGFHLSVICGKAKYMDFLADGRVLHAGTFNSQVGGIAAAAATLDLLSQGDKEGYRRLYDLGRTLMEGVERVAANHGHSLLIQGPGPMFHTGFTEAPAVHNYRQSAVYDGEKLGQFMFGLLQEGIRVLGRGLWYVSLAHDREDIDRAIDAADKVLGQM